MYENIVFVKLVENYKEINYWGELKSEIDFIIEKTAINVTCDDNINKREFQGLEDFSKKHHGFNLIIVSKSLEDKNIIPLQKFLKEDLRKTL